MDDGVDTKEREVSDVNPGLGCAEKYPNGATGKLLGRVNLEESVGLVDRRLLKRCK
jgi:hypothetical protein